MKLKIIKQLLIITILTMYNCIGFTMESIESSNTVEHSNSNIIINNNIENVNEENNECTIFKPVAKLLYRPNIIKRPKGPDPREITEEQELELMFIMHPEVKQVLDYIDKCIIHIDDVLEKFKK